MWKDLNIGGLYLSIGGLYLSIPLMVEQLEFFFSPFPSMTRCHGACDLPWWLADEWTNGTAKLPGVSLERCETMRCDFGMKMEQLEDEDEMCSTAFNTMWYVSPFVDGRLIMITPLQHHLPKNCPCKRCLRGQGKDLLTISIWKEHKGTNDNVDRSKPAQL